MPPAVERAMDATWRAHPGWEYRRHDLRSAAAFLEASPDPGIRKAFRLARYPSQKADLFRYAILAAEGGAFVDATTPCFRSIDRLVSTRHRLVVHQEEKLGSAGDGLLAAAPGHPAIEAAVAAIVDGFLDYANDERWLSSGPGLLSRSVASHVATTGVGCLEGDLLVLASHEVRRAVSLGFPLDLSRGARR